MTTTPVLRRAGDGDAAALARLADQTFREAFASGNTPDDLDAHCARHYGEPQQLAEIRDPALETWVAEIDGALVAYGQLRFGAPSPAVAAARPAEVARFYVEARHHGLGLAPRLMERLLERADAAGADAVWLGVWERNPRAIRFYEKQGFAIVGEKIFVVGADPQRDVVMCRRPAARRAVG
jgi:ribosomal protein S18 acetylase RimI-like enzyme